MTKWTIQDQVSSCLKEQGLIQSFSTLPSVQEVPSLIPMWDLKSLFDFFPFSVPVSSFEHPSNSTERKGVGGLNEPIVDLRLVSLTCTVISYQLKIRTFTLTFRSLLPCFLPQHWTWCCISSVKATPSNRYFPGVFYLREHIQ